MVFSIDDFIYIQQLLDDTTEYKYFFYMRSHTKESVYIICIISIKILFDFLMIVLSVDRNI